MLVLRYFDSSRMKKKLQLFVVVYFEFLCIGCIVWLEDIWVEEEKCYFSYQEVVVIIGKCFECVGEMMYEWLNGFYCVIQFFKLIFYCILVVIFYFGYCYVMVLKIRFVEYDEVIWGFYIVNFFVDIGMLESFFEYINLCQGWMYFVVVMVIDKSGDKFKLVINIVVCGNGFIFCIYDLKQVMKNVLMLGVCNE